MSLNDQGGGFSLTKENNCFSLNLWQVRLDISLEYVGLPVTPEPSEGILQQNFPWF